MSLWDLVRDFFVKYVFGGFAYDEQPYEYMIFYDVEDGNAITSVRKFITLNGYPISLGDYLSLIATIISMVVIVVLACLFIKKIYNMVAHIIA